MITVTARFGAMHPNARRRDRNSLVDVIKIGVGIEGSANARLTDISAAAGATRSEMVQWLIEQCELDADGVPVRWTDTHPKSEQELPMTG